MNKYFLISSIVFFISCLTSKESTTIDHNENNIIASSFIGLAPTILNEYKKTNLKLNTYRVANKHLKDTLSALGISSIAIKYFNDTLNPKEYFSDNTIKLPDSCIIYQQEDIDFNKKKSKLKLFFYFFGRIKPMKFKFATFDPLSEQNTKINDSVWIYKAVYKLYPIS